MIFTHVARNERGKFLQSKEKRSVGNVRFDAGGGFGSLGIEKKEKKGEWRQPSSS